MTLSATDFQSHELLTREEEVELSKLAQAGDEAARERMILCNQGLVRKICGDFEWSGVDADDLFQEGVIGLMRAVESYNAGKAKFSTYAALWIKQRLWRFIFYTQTTIRVPVHVRQAMGRVSKAEFNASGEQVTAESARVSKGQLKAVRRAQEIQMTPLDCEVGGDGPGTGNRMSDIIPDPNAADPRESNELESAVPEISRLLAKLKSDRDRDIIQKRFGLAGQAPLTLEEIGTLYGLTRERIRQLEAKALAKMRLHINGDFRTMKGQR